MAGKAAGAAPASRDRSSGVVIFTLAGEPGVMATAGLPPLVGFQAKLSILQALISTQQPALIGLAVFAVIMALVGAFYYIRVVKVMYFDAPASNEPIRAPLDMRATLSVNGALLLVLGLVPGALMALCAQAIVQMLST